MDGKRRLLQVRKPERKAMRIDHAVGVPVSLFSSDGRRLLIDGRAVFADRSFRLRTYCEEMVDEFLGAQRLRARKRR